MKSTGGSKGTNVIQFRGKASEGSSMVCIHLHHRERQMVRLFIEVEAELLWLLAENFGVGPRIYWWAES